jgi:dCMP deaminase
MSNESKKRPSWDDLFMSMVDQAVERSACIHHPTGSIFVDNDNHIIGFGYSGPSAGDFNCSEARYCLKVDGDPLTGEIKRCNGAHAEMNAIANSGNTQRLKNSTLYCTIYPCYDCMKMLNNIGVRRIVYKKEYRRIIDGGHGKEEREKEAVELAAKRGIIIEKYDMLDEHKIKKAKESIEESNNHIKTKNDSKIISSDKDRF